MRYHAKKIRLGQHPVYKHVTVNVATITTIETMADIKAKLAKTSGVPTPSVALQEQGTQCEVQANLQDDEYDEDPFGWAFGLDQ